MDDVLTGGDLVVVGDREVQGLGLLQEGDFVVKHLGDLDIVGSQDLDHSGLSLKLGLDNGVCDGSGVWDTGTHQSTVSSRIIHLMLS